MSDAEIENVMREIGLLDNSALLDSPSVNKPTASVNNPQLTFQQSNKLVSPSVKLVSPSVKLVNPSGNCPVASGNNNQPNIQLSQLAQQANDELEILVATGKTTDFIGRQLTSQDLNYLSEKEILRYYRVYQDVLAVRVNDTFSKTAVKCYSRLASMLLPIADENKLYEDLRGDYILMNELNRWVGWLSLKAGSLMAVASTSLITVVNISEINDGIIGLSSITASDGTASGSTPSVNPASGNSTSDGAN
jgi:hypothetical protein